MSLAIGNRLPDARLHRLGAEGVRPFSFADYLAGRKVVLFAVPGAFTSTCSSVHLPGYVRLAGELRSRGVAAIACLAANDPFVMAAWAAAHGASESIDMLADGNGELLTALECAADLSGIGLGRRYRRFAAVVDDGVVRALEIEPERGVTCSSAASILTLLDSQG